MHALFVMHFKVSASMVRELRRCSALDGFLVASCYGDGVESYWEQMRRAGWDLTESRAVTGAVSHAADLWRSGEPRACA